MMIRITAIQRLNTIIDNPKGYEQYLLEENANIRKTWHF